MLPVTPTTVFMRKSRFSAAAAAIRLGLFGLDGLLGRLLGIGRERPAFGPEVPPHEVLLELAGGESRRLLRRFGIHLRPRATHQLLGPPGEQDHHPELAVDTFGKILNHAISLYRN